MKIKCDGDGRKKKTYFLYFWKVFNFFFFKIGNFKKSFWNWVFFSIPSPSPSHFIFLSLIFLKIYKKYNKITIYKKTKIPSHFFKNGHFFQNHIWLFPKSKIIFVFFQNHFSCFSKIQNHFSCFSKIILTVFPKSKIIFDFFQNHFSYFPKSSLTFSKIYFHFFQNHF